MNFIPYKIFIEKWILEGSDELRYLSPYKSVPTWLIIDRTYRNYRKFYRSSKLCNVMISIDAKVKIYNDIEIRIVKRLFLFMYADEYIEKEFIWIMCFADNKWYAKGYHLELNKLGKERKNELLEKKVFSKSYSDSITDIIYDHFVLPSDEEILDIIYLLTIVNIINYHYENKINYPEVCDLHVVFPNLNLPHWLCK